jgi:hypothetical protein
MAILTRSPRLWSFRGLALWGLCGVAAFAQRPPADYWPMQVGNTWTIEVAREGKPTPVVVTVVKRTAVTANASEASVEYRVDGKATQVEVYRIDAEGVSRVRSGMDAANLITPPIPIIQRQMQSGRAWTWKGAITLGGGTPMQAAADLSTSAPESVITPAGTFKAIRVHMELTVFGPNGEKSLFTNEYWFALEVGMVQQDFRSGTGTGARGLLSSYRLQP